MISGRIKITTAVAYQLELKITKDDDGVIFVSRVQKNFRDWLKVFSFLIVSSFVFYMCVSATVSHTSVGSDFLRIQYTQRNFNSTTSSLQILSYLSEKETLSVTFRVWNTSAFPLMGWTRVLWSRTSWVLSSCEETTNMIDWGEDDAIRLSHILWLAAPAFFWQCIRSSIA